MLTLRSSVIVIRHPETPKNPFGVRCRNTLPGKVCLYFEELPLHFPNGPVLLFLELSRLSFAFGIKKIELRG